MHDGTCMSRAEKGLGYDKRAINTCMPGLMRFELDEAYHRRFSQ